MCDFVQKSTAHSLAYGQEAVEPKSAFVLEARIRRIRAILEWLQERRLPTASDEQPSGSKTSHWT